MFLLSTSTPFFRLIDSFSEFDKDGALVKNEDGEISVPHDYIIKAVARSLNSVSMAVSKVNVS